MRVIRSFVARALIPVQNIPSSHLFPRIFTNSSVGMCLLHVCSLLSKDLYTTIHRVANLFFLTLVVLQSELLTHHAQHV